MPFLAGEPQPAGLLGCADSPVGALVSQHSSNQIKLDRPRAWCVWDMKTEECGGSREEQWQICSKQSSLFSPLLRVVVPLPPSSLPSPSQQTHNPSDLGSSHPYINHSLIPLATHYIGSIDFSLLQQRWRGNPPQWSHTHRKWENKPRVCFAGPQWRILQLSSQQSREEINAQAT